MKKRCSVLLVLLLVQITMSAQNPDISIDDYYVDFSVPDITAFSILDINTNNVVRPGNVKEFAAGIQNYIDQNGNLKPGLAIEVAPYRLLAKSKKFVPAWRQHKSFKNLQLSIATAQGDSTNLLAAWGINWTPIDKTDPVDDLSLQNFFAKYLSALDDELSDTFAEQTREHLTDVNNFFASLNVEQRKPILELFGGSYQDRLVRYRAQDSISYVENMHNTLLASLEKIQGLPDSTQSPELLRLISENASLTFMEDSVESDFRNRFTGEVKKQKQIFLEENWNRLVVQFKAGAKYTAEEGTVNGLSILNYRIFGGLAGRVPGFAKGEAAKSNFAKNSQIVCQANYTSYRHGTSILNWEFSTGGRLLYGKADKRFSGELQYSKASMKNETNETMEYIRYTLGGEIKVSEGLWFELAVGGQKFLQGDDPARLVPEFGVKYAIQKKSRF